MQIYFYKKNSMATTDEKTSKFQDPKQLAALIMAIAALVTAITSLVKAFDKSLEQQSYETLAGHIQAIQKDQAALREQSINFKVVGRDLDGIPDMPPPGEPSIPVSAATKSMPTPGPSSSSAVAIRLPPSPPKAAPSASAMIPAPPASGSTAALMPPPKWAEVKAAAKKSRDSAW